MILKHMGKRYKCLRFEFIEGQSLDTLNNLTSADLKNLALQMVHAISDLWDRGIVHRDIKPANIMRKPNGNFVLVDLGIGYFMGDFNKDNTKSKGSRYYSSPEQFFSSTDSEVEITFSSDIYSLGVVLYEKLVGQHPNVDFNSRYGSYCELVTNGPEPIVPTIQPDDDVLTNFINVALRRYKINRFLHPSKAVECLGGVSRSRGVSTNHGQTFVHDNQKYYSLLDCYFQDDSCNNPDAVIVTPLQSEKRIEGLREKGYRVVVDPITYKLNQDSKREGRLRKKLGLTPSEMSNDLQILRSQPRLIKQVVKIQLPSELIILPYFAINTLEDGLLTLNKSIWREGRKTVNGLGYGIKAVYGGLVIPSSIVEDALSTKKLINKVHGAYDLDGFYLTFEAPSDNSVKSIDSYKFLTNFMNITRAFSSMGDVIIGYADPVYTLLCPEQTLAYGWSQPPTKIPATRLTLKVKAEEEGVIPLC